MAEIALCHEMAKRFDGMYVFSEQNCTQNWWQKWTRGRHGACGVPQRGHFSWGNINRNGQGWIKRGFVLLHHWNIVVPISATLLVAKADFCHFKDGGRVEVTSTVLAKDDFCSNRFYWSFPTQRYPFLPSPTRQSPFLPLLKIQIFIFLYLKF